MYMKIHYSHIVMLGIVQNRDCDVTVSKNVTKYILFINYFLFDILSCCYYMYIYFLRIYTELRITKKMLWRAWIKKKCGLINISYTMEKSGFLVKNTGTTYYMFLELIRMIILITCTFLYHDPSFPLVQIILIMKFWTVVISARISEMWIIKYEFH